MNSEKVISTPHDEDLQRLGVIENLRGKNLKGRIVFDNKNQSYANGSYGEVYTGSLKLTGGGEVKVAIKSVRFSLKDNNIVKKVVARELYIWEKLDHINVLSLRKFILDDSGIPSLISDWMENGSVLDFVKSKPNECNVAHLIHGIAKGLAYLHENGVVHSDIKSDNVLVSADENAKICDFGISRAINATQIALGGNSSDLYGPKGTARWMAYELISDPKTYTKHTKESDVWSFGMTAYILGFSLSRTFEDNILVSSAGDAMIADFGICLALNASPMESLRWTAYELLAECEGYATASKQSDVWSFGMTVFELLTGIEPYFHIRNELHILSQLEQDKLPSPPPGYFEAWPSYKKEVQKMCETCCNKDPARRPSMGDIVTSLRRIRAEAAVADMSHAGELESTAYLSSVIQNDGPESSDRNANVRGTSSTSASESSIRSPRKRTHSQIDRQEASSNSRREKRARL
ncbi:hypothetical protein EW145_g1995 [Phellinidium pouzarii]|uniref:Protein kinase domain-containing protein n=1 Tax=Phellinidium pouzarii TaxID=167371 RepID=A0A4S4LCI1_9AGAM|nr:hypothetical protein EW145_g1995 [Phellinidium pouzarii]